jgi:hypothetical protein
LRDILPEWQHPKFRKSINSLIEECVDYSIIRKL